jgi:endonuclease/exonuclease/phosphatase family metal-dependent hydrolase
MNTISLITINIEYGKRNPKYIKEKSDLIMKYEPDIVLIQESNLKSINIDEKYDLIQFSCKKIKEKMDIFVKKNSPWKLNSLNHIFSELGHVKRICKIISVKNKETNKQLNIANIHLVGGRFEENDKIGKMLIGNIKTIRNRKNEILEKLIHLNNIDIIAGDFNSDLNCYLNDGNLQEQHLKFMMKVSPKKDLEIYKEWNNAPYKFLKNNNYILSKNNDSNTINTSLFNTHPDSIWYKHHLDIQDYKIIDFLTDNLSDHNGIYVKLKL